MFFVDWLLAMSHLQNVLTGVRETVMASIYILMQVAHKKPQMQGCGHALTKCSVLAKRLIYTCKAYPIEISKIAKPAIFPVKIFISMIFNVFYTSGTYILH